MFKFFFWIALIVMSACSLVFRYIRYQQIKENNELTAEIKAKTNELASIIRVNLHASDSAILAQDSLIRQLRSEIFVLRSKLK